MAGFTFEHLTLFNFFPNDFLLLRITKTYIYNSAENLILSAYSSDLKSLTQKQSPREIL